MGFVGGLILGGSYLAASFCALNAVLDFRRFNLLGRIFCFAWFAAIAVMTAIILYGLGTRTEFDRM